MASCANCSNAATYQYSDGTLFCSIHLPLMLRSSKWSHLVTDYVEPTPVKVKEEKKIKVEEPVVEDATD
jgi:hypothetical protein